MEIKVGLFDSNADPITESEDNLALKIYREADGYMLDWNDLTFKASGWTSLTTVMSEIDDTNLAGYYKKDIVVSGWDDGRYFAHAAHTVSPKQNLELDITIENGAPAERVSQVNVFSAVGGAIQVAYATEAGTVRVVRSNAVNLPYDLPVDMSSKKLYLAVKRRLGDVAYMIPVTDITSGITDAAEGQGVIPFTAAMLALAPDDYAAEVEMRDNDGVSNPLTILKFTLQVVGKVV